MSVVAAPARQVRGPHAERSAAMRRRLIEAAIACLFQTGYAATTTQAVTDRARVSRGAILHHFPTKVDLMVAVAEYAARHQNRSVRRRLTRVEPGLPLYLAITRATWEAAIQPPTMALLEVMMATRSDPELARRLPAVVEAFETHQRDDVLALARRLGVTDLARAEAMVRLHRAAIRGLAIELNLTRDRAGAEAGVQLLEHYKRLLTDELMASTGPLAV